MSKSKYNNEEIIKGYIELCRKLGRVANVDDISKCDYLPHSWTVRNRFGSTQKLQELSGIMKNGELSGKPLKEEVEKILINKRIHRGRRLDYLEVSMDQDLPHVDYVRRLYNNKPLNEIWDEIESKIPRRITDYLGI